MKIGIPRSLLYFRYGEFWANFLRNLGADVLLSPKTNKEIVDLGVKYSSSEVCLPIKVAIGHIEFLKEKVDAIFLPRLVWLKDKLYACPKMLGLPDIARFHCQDSTEIILPKIKNNFSLPHLQVGLRLNKNPMRVIKAYLSAKKYLKKNSHFPDFPPYQKRIAIISHFYNLYDEYIGGDVPTTFRSKGFRVYTKEELPFFLLERGDGFAKRIRWIYERELYNSFRFYLDKVDGICFLFSFACGPDSLIGELMIREAKKVGIPFLQIVLDEHTGKAGILTRIEAFCDTILRRVIR